MQANDFDWNNDEDVIVRTQRATAVHLNRFGYVVIRQEREWPDEDVDPCLVFSPENVPNLIDALAKLVGYTISSPVQLVDGTEPASRDLTAADRQRRWRKRNGRNGDGTVMRNGRNGELSVTPSLPLLDNHNQGD